MGDLLDLAREAVALPGWRWMPGMRAFMDGHIGTVYGHNTNPGEPEWLSWQGDDGGYLNAWPAPAGTWECLPAWQPATLGCLLALVREACGVGRVWCLPCGSDVEPWRVYARPAVRSACLGRGPTEAHALVAALRAAGGARG